MSKIAVFLCAVVIGFCSANSNAFAKSLATHGSVKFDYDEPPIDIYNRSIGLSKAALHCLQTGNARLGAGKTKDAIVYFDRAIALNPRYASAFDNRGIARSNLGDRAGAERDYKMAIKLNPKFASPWNNLGTLKYSYDLKGAAAAYTESIRIYPDCAAYDNRATARELLGDSKGAMRDFDEAIKLSPNYARAYAGRGYLFFELGRLEDALDDCNHAIKLDSTDAWSYEARGKIFSQLERYVEALADFNEAVRLDPTSGRYYRSRGLERAKNWFDLYGAIQDFDKQISLDPKLADGYVNRAEVKFKVLDDVGATNDLEMAIHLEPHYMWAYNVLGNSRFDRKQAEQDFTRAIMVDPTYASAYSERGYVRAKLGNLHGAIQDFSEAIKLKPNDAWNYSTRGNLRAEVGDTAGAIADLSESIRINSYLRCYLSSELTTILALHIRAHRLHYCERALLRAKIGDLRGAIQDYVTVSRSDPGAMSDYLSIVAHCYSPQAIANSITTVAAKLWRDVQSGTAFGAHN